MRFTLRKLLITSAVAALAFGGISWVFRIKQSSERYKAKVQMFALAEERNRRYSAACYAAHEASLRQAENQGDIVKRRKYYEAAIFFASQAVRCQRLAETCFQSKTIYEKAARNPLRSDPDIEDPPAEDFNLRDKLMAAKPIVEIK